MGKFLDITNSNEMIVKSSRVKQALLSHEMIITTQEA